MKLKKFIKKYCTIYCCTKLWVIHTDYFSHAFSPPFPFLFCEPPMGLKIFSSRQTTLIMELQFHKTMAGTKSGEKKNITKILSINQFQTFKKKVIFKINTSSDKCNGKKYVCDPLLRRILSNTPVGIPTVIVAAMNVWAEIFRSIP